jgi:hypothetical protein
MSDSPIAAVLAAIDSLDLDRALRLFAPSGNFVTAFGAEATGTDQLRQQLTGFFAGLHGCAHTVDTEWHPEPEVWIAEVTATYELEDFSERGPYKRVLVLRQGDDGIASLRIYGAHELPLTSSAEAYQEVRGPNGWLPTL